MQLHEQKYLPRILNVPGIGFKTADTLAPLLGIPRDAVIRAQTDVRHGLQTFADEGDCAVIQLELIEAAVMLPGAGFPVARGEQGVENASPPVSMDAVVMSTRSV